MTVQADSTPLDRMTIAAWEQRHNIPDFTIENHGSILLFRPNTEAANDWLDNHIDPAQSMFYGPALVVEPRYANFLTNAIRNDGLVV